MFGLWPGQIPTPLWELTGTPLLPMIIRRGISYIYRRRARGKGGLGGTDTKKNGSSFLMSGCPHPWQKGVCRICISPVSNQVQSAGSAEPRCGGSAWGRKAARGPVAWRAPQGEGGQALCLGLGQYTARLWRLNCISSTGAFPGLANCDLEHDADFRASIMACQADRRS